MNSKYQEFLKRKEIKSIDCGIEADIKNPGLYQFQKDIVGWALRKGRAAVFTMTGTGKTRIQLEWCSKICEYTKGKALILAPLAVSNQTIVEGKKIGIEVTKTRNQKDVKDGINITNYEMLEHYESSAFDAIALDESSILKSYDGKTRTKIITSFSELPFRLACTATPAPNDYMELGNHAEFLGVMSRAEMLSMFFVHDGGETSKWRLKGHAKKDFWEWVASWACVLTKPSDLGYDDTGYILPELKITEHIVESNKQRYTLFAVPASTLQERQKAKRDTLAERTEKCFNLVKNKINEKWLIWCNLNSEQDTLKKLFGDLAVSIQGSTSNDEKLLLEEEWRERKIPVLITKPSVFGYGMNWQHCNNMAFVGISDSFEMYFQAIRRCWRFGQNKPVNVHLIISEEEGAIKENIERKERDAINMIENMVKLTKDITRTNIKKTTREVTEYDPTIDITLPAWLEKKEIKSKVLNQKISENFAIYHGDSVEIIQNIPDESIHYSIFSPPFASLYTYSNSERDMGNTKNDEEFMIHFGFLVREMFRITKKGRLLSFHCMNLPTSKQNHGYIGLRDFRGELIRLFVDCGWIYHSEVVIWKDPVIAMQRTKALGLLHKQLKKDATMCRQGIPDYLVTMRKPGENVERVTNTNETFPVSIWQQYASPVWMDINPSNTLQRTSAREQEDERHICPLQLEVIERAIKLWTNEKDVVFSPFLGIGSEGFVSLKQKRKFIGVELKKSYFEQAVKNLERAENSEEQISLFQNKEIYEENTDYE